MTPATLLFAAAMAAGPVVGIEPAVSGLDHPVAVAHAGDSRLFIAEQGGLLRVHDGTKLLADPFLDLRGKVTTGGERGLLGVAFDPQHATNGFFYVDYTDLSGNTVIDRYTVSASDPNRADPNSRLQILHVDQPFANHNGGQLQFGLDGYLYVGLGDGGSAGDPGNRAQNRSELLGKILRLDVSRTPYAVPSSNPFAGTPGTRAEIWAYGLRNPWRFSFDRATGDLWIADVGQGSWEEIDFQPASSPGGENYGWRRMEGSHCYNPTSGCNDGTLVLPVIEYEHTGGACSVTGGYVYRGARNPRLTGIYFYGDYCNGRIRGATRSAGGAVTSVELYDAPFPISTFGEDAAGEIYVADYSGGTLYRIIDTAPGAVRRRAVRSGGN